jgi:hypothetical protein
MLANLALPVVNGNPSQPEPARRPRFVVGTFLTVFVSVLLASLVFTLTSTKLYQGAAILKLPFSPVIQMTDISDTGGMWLTVLHSTTVRDMVEQSLIDGDRRDLIAPYLHSSATGLTLLGNVLAENIKARFSPHPQHRHALLLSVQFRHPDRMMAAKVANRFAEQLVAFYAQQQAELLARVVRDFQPVIDQLEHKVQELTDVLQVAGEKIILAQSNATTSEIARLTAEHQSRQRELVETQERLQGAKQRLAEIVARATSPRGLDDTLPPVIEAAAIPPAEGDYTSPRLRRALGLGFLLALGGGLIAAGMVWFVGCLFGGQRSA